MEQAKHLNLFHRKLATIVKARSEFAYTQKHVKIFNSYPQYKNNKDWHFLQTNINTITQNETDPDWPCGYMVEEWVLRGIFLVVIDVLLYVLYQVV